MDVLFVNSSLNHIHKRDLRLIYDDHADSFQDILQMANEITIHQKNLIYGSSPPIMNDFFEVTENIYKLRNFHSLYCTCKTTVRFISEAVTFRGSQIWNLIPDNKNVLSLENFQREIKKIERRKVSM